jgi:hypothetical protein
MADRELSDSNGEKGGEKIEKISPEGTERDLEDEASPENPGLTNFVRETILEDAGKAKAAIIDKIGPIDTEKAMLFVQIAIAGLSVAGLAGIAAGKIIMPKIKERLPEEVQSLMDGAVIREKVGSFAAEAKGVVVKASDGISLFMRSLKDGLRVDELKRSIMGGIDHQSGVGA